jgi:C4-type Zn-finger protein
MQTEKECPMCGGEMRLREVERAEHVPGTAHPRTRLVREWLCRDCDYFEEALDD